MPSNEIKMLVWMKKKTGEIAYGFYDTFKVDTAATDY